MDTTSTKTVVISGANGYFGRIAQIYFKSQGWQVLKACRDQDRDIWFDLDSPNLIAQSTIGTSANLFIHAAAAHEVVCRQAPYQSIYQNVAGTRAALEFCVNNDISKFIYLSTFHVFGNPDGLIDERTTPAPANDYGLTNRLSEEYVELYRRQGKLQGTVIRPSNFFGVPASLDHCQRWTLTPLAFCRQAVEQGKIVLKTPGYQKRNFISIRDLCGVIEAVTDSMDEFPLLHAVGPDTLSIRELAQCVQNNMKMHLDCDIELALPEGKPEVTDFFYESCYLDDLYKPSERLNEFIAELCTLLSERAPIIC